MPDQGRPVRGHLQGMVPPAMLHGQSAPAPEIAWCGNPRSPRPGGALRSKSARTAAWRSFSPEERDGGLERALTAKTYAELAALTADPPATPGATVGRGERHAEGSDTDPRPQQQRPPDNAEGTGVEVTGGSVTLDFTEAVITQPLLRIIAEVRGGGRS